MSRKIRVPQKPKDHRAFDRSPEPEWKERKRTVRQKHIKKKVKYKQKLNAVDIVND
jgi:hypothetical protein